MPDGQGAESQTVTRADLARAVQDAVGLPRTQAAYVVEMVLNEIFDCVVTKEDVKLSSFGTFSVREKRERVGRNPKTGAGAKVSARLVVSFKPSNVMRERVHRG
jgi:integration host factor subunit alpha